MKSDYCVRPFEIAVVDPHSGREQRDLWPRLRDALSVLLQAAEYANDVGQDPWEMAVEVSTLRTTRLTTNDLRWLAAKGFTEHGTEVTTAGDQTRQFRRTPLLNVCDATCVILTPRGIAAAQDALTVGSSAELASAKSVSNGVAAPDDRRNTPKWDHQRRQLRVHATIIKEFKLPSPNQESILTAFEEESWPPRIFDPLTPSPLLDARRRLHDTIKALNRNQKQELVRFMGDGSGEGIRWEFTKRTVRPSRRREL